MIIIFGEPVIGMFCLRALLAARYHNGIHSIPTPRYGTKNKVEKILSKKKGFYLWIKYS